MIESGKYNQLKAFRETEFGWYLTDEEESEEILLPNKFVPEDFEEDQKIKVFVFNDSEDRLTATTQKPKIQLHEFACLKAVEVNKIGAFMDWGMDKDLLVPFSEQDKKMEAGKKYIVYLLLDDQTERLYATSRLGTVLEKITDFEEEEMPLKEGEAVELMIGEKTDLGYKVIIEERFEGLIFQNEIFHKINIGDEVKGFIKKIREDGKIDVSLQKQGYQNAVPDFAQKILTKMKRQQGFLELTDKSHPEDIYEQLQMSKKNFKKAVGALYRQKLIFIKDDGLYLNVDNL